MNDIKILAIKDVLQVVQVRLIPGFFPASVEIIGNKLLQADEVTINDLPSPEFVKLSNSKIIAQMPLSQARSSVRKVSVLASSPNPDRRSILRFEAGPTFSKLKGLEKLIQQFTKLLLQTPGSDAFSPELGGGLQTIIGQGVSRKHTQGLAASLVSAVNRTRDQIFSLQSNDSRIPPDEKLLRADTQGVGFDPNTTTLAARVSIGAISGKQAVANLTF